MQYLGILIPIIALMISIVALLVKPINRWLDIKEKQAETLTGETAEKAARYAAQSERLEQRIRVLERIITEDKHELAREIEDLRDKPLN